MVISVLIFSYEKVNGNDRFIILFLYILRRTIQNY